MACFQASRKRQGAYGHRVHNLGVRPGLQVCGDVRTLHMRPAEVEKVIRHQAQHLCRFLHLLVILPTASTHTTWVFIPVAIGGSFTAVIGAMLLMLSLPLSTLFTMKLTIHTSAQERTELKGAMLLLSAICCCRFRPRRPPSLQYHPTSPVLACWGAVGHTRPAPHPSTEQQQQPQQVKQGSASRLPAAAAVPCQQAMAPSAL